MLASDLEDSLEKLKDCDYIRHSVSGTTLTLAVVGDNEKEPEDPDDDHACDELNGHRFDILFEGVRNLSVTGEEADTYTTKQVIVSSNALSLTYEGANFMGATSTLILSFHYDFYHVVDKGRIPGPDA